MFSMKIGALDPTFDSLCTKASRVSQYKKGSHIIHERCDANDAALLSLDARQASDRIDSFNVLPRYGFGNLFLRWVQLL